MKTMKHLKSISLIASAFVIGLSTLAFANYDYPTVHEYLLENKNTRLVGVAKYKIDGYSAICGRRPTILNSRFDSWGGSYPGFIIMNPKANRKLTTTVKMFIYAHECGHQFQGAGELRADNFAIRRGVLWGWLKNRTGMNQICHFINKIPADAVHPPGTERCRKMMIYYNELLQRRAKN